MRIGERACKVAFMTCNERPLVHELFEGKAARYHFEVWTTCREGRGERKGPASKNIRKEEDAEQEGKNTVMDDHTSRTLWRGEGEIAGI
jgi:hypothetical protein